jgi:UDPglucose 6-dehydrogenase
MRIGIVGSGYVGLVVGSCLADTGNDVVCIEVDPEKLKRIQAGEPWFYEPGLGELMKRNTAEGRLTFARDARAACRDIDVAFIAVGTPPGDDGSADLAYVLEAARQVAQAADDSKQSKIIVMKSTVPVGTCKRVEAVVAEVTTVHCPVVSNPEFLKEGGAVEDFMKPDRVIIGTDDEEARLTMGDLYAPFVRTGKPIIYMKQESAELTKYTANALLAVRISFMNEIARLCERVGADVDQIRRGIGADTRIGYQFLFPGAGFGGSCFPKDIRALSHTARTAGQELELVDAAARVNVTQRTLVADKVLAHFDGNVDGRPLAVWGLAFKPRTDDVREAPSIYVIERLLERGARITAHDPAARETAREILGDRVRYADMPYEALDGADALIVVTEWNEYRHPDFREIKRRLRAPVLFDGRNIWDPARLRTFGFTYIGIGRV